MGFNNMLDTASAPISVGKGGTGVNNPPAYSVIVSNNSSSSGPLNFVSSAGVGSFLLSQGASAPVFASLTIPPGAFTTINYQTFSTPGTYTYTPSANTKYAFAQLQGAGGGGGGAFDGCAGGPGGGGAYFYLVIAPPPSSAAVVVGAGGSGGLGFSNGTDGGDTSIDWGSGANIAGGGQGGSGQTNSGFVNQISGAPGAGGTTTFSGGGSVIYYLNGEAGSYGYYNGHDVVAVGGTGGNSFFGQGAPSQIQVAGGSTFINALKYGGGGGPAVSSTSGSTQAGSGSDGIIIITEFIST